MRSLITAAAAFMALATPASAGVLSLDPSDQTVGLGETFTVDVRVSLDDNVDLASFFIDVLYDDTLLDFVSLDYGDALGEVGVDALDLPPGPDEFSGIVNLELESFLSDFSAQADEFVIGVITFMGTGIGDTLLEFGDFAELVAPDLSSIDFDAVDGSASVVPVPGAVWLFGAGLAGLAGLRRRRA